ncbi:MAG: hypothetical protein JWO53_990, partial [Chlamydiia bacterium]|nr:hypothetical protein [Chlamydiia bacterium]
TSIFETAPDTFFSKITTPLAPQITTITLPQLTSLFPPAMKISYRASSDKETDTYFCTFSKLIKALQTKYKDAFTASLEDSSCVEIENLQLQQITLSDEGKEAFRATIAILEELLNGKYTKEAAIDYTKWSCNLLWNHWNGGATKEQQKAQNLYQKVRSGNFIVKERTEDECGHNPAYLLLDNTESQTPFAIFKQTQPGALYDSSHQHIVEEMPLYRVDVRELVGYEVDALIGCERTPITLKVTYEKPKNDSKQEKEAGVGILQLFVSNGIAAGEELWKKNGAKLVKTLDKSRAQITALSGILKGRGAGHMNNYLLVKNPEKEEVLEALDIDLEECMIPFNRIPDHMRIKRYSKQEVYCENLEEKVSELSEQLAMLAQDTTAHSDREKLQQQLEQERVRYQQRIATERKMISMCRLWILGLPQNEKPFDKAALLILCHPSLPRIMDAHHAHMIEKRYEIQISALIAQKERLMRLRELAHKELIQETITASPRDFYFDLFGAKELYQIAIGKHYPDIFVFGQLVGCPYRHQLKDFSRPEVLGTRDPTKPKNDSEDARIVFENIQELEKPL